VKIYWQQTKKQNIDNIVQKGKNGTGGSDGKYNSEDLLEFIRIEYCILWILGRL